MNKVLQDLPPVIKCIIRLLVELKVSEETLIGTILFLKACEESEQENFLVWAHYNRPTEAEILEALEKFVHMKRKYNPRFLT